MKSLPYYTPSAVDDTSEVIKDICAEVGLTMERIPTEQTTANPDSTVFLISEDGWDFEIRFGSESDSQVPAPEIVIAGTSWLDNPWERGIEDDEYQRRVDRLFEVICRLAMALEVEYAPMLGFVDPLQVWPTDRPLAENIEELPILGIYSESILEDFGGLSEMFDGSLWYVAELPSGHTVVVQEDFPWNKKDWMPPRDAVFLETTSFHEPTAARNSAEDTHQSNNGFEDPFAALETGAIGTDLCVPREEIGPEFRNEDLEVVRVRIDEERNLRRLEDGTLVRNIVDDAPDDDVAFMMAMLDDVPADAAEDDLMVSSLLRDAIPPAFVRLDDSSDETVVSRVAALDSDINKVELLVTLGRVARETEFAAGDVQEMEQVLERLETLNDTVDLDQYLRERLL